MPRVDNKSFYDRSLKEHKRSVKALHWNSKSTQEARFEAIAVALKRFEKIESLVDAGCGFADLYHYLKKLDLLPKQYIGIDTHGRMVELAKQRSGQRILKADVLSDVLPFADIYVCSGAMNTLYRYETMLFIKNMLAHAKKGVVFNLLKGEDSSQTYNKFLPHELKAMLKPLGVSCEIIEGYLEDDFTVMIRL